MLRENEIVVKNAIIMYPCFRIKDVLDGSRPGCKLLLDTEEQADQIKNIKDLSLMLENTHFGEKTLYEEEFFFKEGLELKNSAFHGYTVLTCGVPHKKDKKTNYIRHMTAISQFDKDYNILDTELRNFNSGDVVNAAIGIGFVGTDRCISTSCRCFASILSIRHMGESIDFFKSRKPLVERDFGGVLWCIAWKI